MLLVRCTGGRNTASFVAATFRPVKHAADSTFASKQVHRIILARSSPGRRATVPIAIRANLAPSAENARLAAARELGADGVELTFGPHDYEHHALWRPGGPASLRLQARENGVA